MAVTLRKVTDRLTGTPCLYNVPCPSVGRTYTPLRTIAGKPVAKITDRLDYSDGYGTTYAKGE